MTRIIAGFARANAALARGFDRVLAYPPRHVGHLTPHELKILFAEGEPRLFTEIGLMRLRASESTVESIC